MIGDGDGDGNDVFVALFLTKFASKVSIVHRRDQLRASKVNTALLQSHS